MSAWLFEAAVQTAQTRGRLKSGGLPTLTQRDRLYFHSSTLFIRFTSLS